MSSSLDNNFNIFSCFHQIISSFMRYDSSIENKCFHTIFEKQHEWGTKHYLIDLFDEFERKNGYSTELKSRRLHFRGPESISCVTVLRRTIAEANIPQSNLFVSSN